MFAFIVSIHWPCVPAGVLLIVGITGGSRNGGQCRHGLVHIQAHTWALG